MLHWLNMNKHQSPLEIGHARIAPTHTYSTPSEHPKGKALNRDEPRSNPSEPVRTSAEPLEEVWITVDEAVTYCAEQGLARTAKTLRKWAERSFNMPEGDVVSRREDTIWGRYRWNIEKASLVREVAEELSRERVQTSSNGDVPSRSNDADLTTTNSSEPVRTGLNASRIQPTEKALPIKAAPGSHPTEQVRTGSKQLVVTNEATEELATLRAENKILRELIERDKGDIDFLREQVTSDRSLKTEFAKTSQQLLETLETLATGGRLRQPTAPATSVEAVRYQPAPRSQGEV